MEIPRFFSIRAEFFRFHFTWFWMASKSGKHYKKSSKSSKKGFKKTTGGASYRNYSKKSKNLDYKYRILDIADTN